MSLRTSRSQLVERTRIGVEDLCAFCFRERRLEGEARIVEIPVRIVRGEQQPVRPDPVDHRTQMFCIVRLVDRLRREPEVLADIFGRPALEMRHLIAESVKMLVHPPGGRRNPSKAAFDEYDFQTWKTLGHALDHQTR